MNGEAGQMPGAFTIFPEFLCKQTLWVTEMYCPGTVLWPWYTLWCSKAGGSLLLGLPRRGGALVYRVPVRTSGESKVWPTETLAGHWLTMQHASNTTDSTGHGPLK